MITRLLYITFILLIVSCTGTKHLPDGEKLYTQASCKLESNEKITKKKKIKKVVQQNFRPKPNKSYLWGMRPGVWAYYLVNDSSKKKGIKPWIKKKLGEPPVFISDVNPMLTATYIDSKLYNHGIFKAYTEFKIIEHKKTATVKYISHIHEPYKIKEVIYPNGSSVMDSIINKSKKRSLLNPGDDYNLDVIKAERERIDLQLKNKGFFYFNPDYILFAADTSATNRTITLKLTIKKETPARALLVYHLDSVFINPVYSLDSINTGIPDTLKIEDVYFLSKKLNVRPKVLLRSVFLKKGDVYSRRRHDITLNRLMSLGIYKYINIRFDSDTLHPGVLNALILLTPNSKRTFRSEFTVVSKSNNFIGPQLNLNYKNRNSFNGAELLNLNLSSSVETQFSGKYKYIFSYEISPQADLYLPYFAVPFKIKEPKSFYIPKTKISTSYSYLKRVGYFNFLSFKFSYGYKWKQDKKREHEFNPIVVNLTSVTKKSTEFESLLNKNPLLKKSYEEQLILGLFYSYTYNEQLIPYKKSQFYINVRTETSGNLLSLAERTIGREPSPAKPLTIGNRVYSQFSRVAIDMRNFFNFDNKDNIAVRLFSGVGVPYGNSATLPYIQQFFAGGPNSIRAFRINSVGPGSYQAPQNNLFFEQGGNIKLEGNAEYRATIISVLKGAVFVDAGNTWLLKRNPAIDSDPFTFSGFSRDIAVGTGVGLRIDVSFFVLRFDLAFPLRKPWLPETDRWVFDEIDFGSASWRKQNLVLNIAIGYPF